MGNARTHVHWVTIRLMGNARLVQAFALAVQAPRIIAQIARIIVCSMMASVCSSAQISLLQTQHQGNAVPVHLLSVLPAKHLLIIAPHAMPHSNPIARNA